MKTHERTFWPRRAARAVVLLAAAGALAPLSLAAQAPSPASAASLSAGEEAFAAAAPAAPSDDPLGLDWLVGEWEGEGWIRLGTNGRQPFVQHERVRPALGGRALVLEGTAFATADGRVLDELGPVHQALAVLTRDPATGEPAFRAYRMDGERILAVDAEAEITGGTLVWGFRDPAFGEMRYTLVRTPEGEWLETGRISPDGERWFDFFEMRLRRVPPSPSS